MEDGNGVQPFSQHARKTHAGINLRSNHPARPDSGSRLLWALFEIMMPLTCNCSHPLSNAQWRLI
jgi:hypothetical protein